MNDVAVQIATAAALLWLGMVAAISFLEAPLKFRADGVDLRVGLAIGRVVFRALNTVEVAWAMVIAATLLIDSAPSIAVTAAASVAVVLLAAQLGIVRPRLNHRSDRVLAGEDVPRSASHHLYIALEIAKVIALIALSAWLLTE